MDEARRPTTDAIRSSKLQRPGAPDVSYEELGSGENALLFTPVVLHRE
jgi:hypothetical protein